MLTPEDAKLLPPTVKAPNQRRQVPWPFLTWMTVALAFLMIWHTSNSTALHPVVFPTPLAASPFLFPDVISVVILESPTPVLTATPRPSPTVQPTMPALCGMNAKQNEVCEWPQPTPLQPTMVPPCGTPLPGDECLWRE